MADANNTTFQTEEPAANSVGASPNACADASNRRAEASDITDDLSALRPTIEVLLSVQGFRGKLFRAVFVAVGKLFDPIVYRRDYRSGAVTRSELRHSSTIDRETATQLSEQWLESVLTEVQCESGTQVTIKEAVAFDQPVTVLYASFADLHSGESDGGLALLLPGAKRKNYVAARRLEKLITLAISLTDRVSVDHASTAGVSSANAVDSAEHSMAIHPVGHSASESASLNFSSLREFAYKSVNELCNQFACDQVGFGRIKNNRARVIAISGLASFKSNSPGVGIMRQAMEECYDGKTSILFQLSNPETAASETTAAEASMRSLSPTMNGSKSTNHLHQQWSRDSANACVLSIPLMLHTLAESPNGGALQETANDIHGVISLRRNPNRPFSRDEETQIKTKCEQIAPQAALIAVRSRSLRDQMGDSLRSGVRTILRPHSISRAILQGCLLCLIGWFCFGSMQFRPICQTSVVPINMRHFCAPFEGRLEQVFVHAGDRVSKGEVLARFETRDLELQLTSVLSEISAKQIDMRNSLDANDVETAAVNQAEIDVLRTTETALRKKIEDALLVAPADGVIVRCDVRNEVGKVFALGDPILEFAANEGFLLEIQIPDSIATHLSVGQQGAFAAAARPDETLEFEITQLAGSAQVLETENVFIAEARLESKPEWLRAGMQGTVRVETAEQPIWWVTLRSAVDWMRMRFWL